MLNEIFEYSSNIIVRKMAKIIKIFNLPKYLTILLIANREGYYRQKKVPSTLQIIYIDRSFHNMRARTTKFGENMYFILQY